MLVVSDLTRLSHLMEKSTFPSLLSINSISLLVFNHSNPYQQENTCSEHGQRQEHSATSPDAAGRVFAALSPPHMLPIPLMSHRVTRPSSHHCLWCLETGQVEAKPLGQPNATTPQPEPQLLMRLHDKGPAWVKNNPGPPERAGMMG